MKRVVVVMSLALCFVLGYFCIALTAQEQTKEAAVVEHPSDAAAAVILSANGVVGNISSNELVLKEYNMESGETTDIIYTMDPEVKIVNADALEAITPGTKLDVSYVVEDGKKIAKALTVVVEQSEKSPVPVVVK